MKAITERLVVDSNPGRMNIAFNINSLALVGLGVSISSIIRNSSDCNRLKFWFLCVNLTRREKSQIERLLNFEDFFGTYEFIDYDPISHFGSFRPLHGDWTTYGRLLLADMIHEDQVLYLDADLVVELDVLDVQDFDFGGQALAAVGGGKYKYTLGRDFYINKLGISPEVEYFNSGVLLINLPQWRTSNVKERCLEIARKYPNELPSHDQSLLNLIIAGNFSKLPPSFNCEWLAYQFKPIVSEKMILHFIGSPKPWDPMGFFLHKGYQTWKRYLSPEWSAEFGHYGFADYKRVWLIRRSYLRTIKNILMSSKINTNASG